MIKVSSMKINQIPIILSIIITVSVLVFLSFEENISFAQNDKTNEQVPDFTISTTSSDVKTKVIIKNKFSIGLDNRPVVVDRIIDRYSIDKQTAEKMLEIEQVDSVINQETIFITAKADSGITDVVIQHVFTIDTIDSDKIINAIVENSKLTKDFVDKQIGYEITETEIIAKVEKGEATVQILYNGLQQQFVLDTTDPDKIISAISEVTNFRDYKIPRIWDFETDVVEELEMGESLSEFANRTESIISNAEKQMQRMEQAQEGAMEGNLALIGESSGGFGCLIATATFGSELAPQVQFLREIRDNTVMSTSSGASFMTGFNAIYYSFSPAVADLERQNPIFKETVKIAITPLLSTLSLLNYVEIDSESEMLGYGIGIILLNVGMYFVAPAIIILKLKNRINP